MDYESTAAHHLLTSKSPIYAFSTWPKLTQVNILFLQKIINLRYLWIITEVVKQTTYYIIRTINEMIHITVAVHNVIQTHTYPPCAFCLVEGNNLYTYIAHCHCLSDTQKQWVSCNYTYEHPWDTIPIHLLWWLLITVFWSYNKELKDIKRYKFTDFF
jgi:hypothetical protein